MSYDKRQAAAFLGVTERAVERYRSMGLLTPQQVKEPGADGRTRTVNVYDLEQLERLKQLKQEKEAAGIPLTQDARTPGQLEQIKQRMQQSEQQSEQTGTALIQTRGAADLAQLVAQIIAAGRAQLPGQRPAVAIESKLTLSLAEAAALSGFTPNYLRKALKEGKLDGAQRGRGWNIKRADLEDFVSRL